MEFLKNKKYILGEIIFLFLISLVPLLWFKPGNIVVGLDSGYAINYIQYFQQRTFSWLSSHNFGVDMSIEIGAVIFSALPALVNALGISQFDVQKVLFVFWFLTLSLSMYAFSSYFFPKKNQWAARLIAVFIYIFNLHIYSFWLQGEQAILVSYALLPLFLLFILRFIDKKTSALKSAIYLNLVYFFFSAGGIRGVPLIGPVIISSALIFLYFLFVNFKNEGFNYVKRFLTLFLWGGILFILSNAYYLLPFLASFNLQYGNQVTIVGGVSGAVEWAKSISVYTSLINLFRLNGDNNWYDKPFLWSYPFLKNPLLIIGSFIFPIAAFVAPLTTKIHKEKNNILFFVILALVGLFFSAGAHPPLGNIFILLMEKVPGFAAFRSPYYKFMPIVYFAFAILIGVTVANLSVKFLPKRSILFGILCLAFVISFNYPFFTNSNFAFDAPFSSMLKVPDYVKDLAKANVQKSEYRTLVVPPPNYFGDIKAYTWGYWAAYPIFSLVTGKGFVINDAFGYNTAEDETISALNSSLRTGDFRLLKSLAESTNVKYILVTHDVAFNYDKSLSEDPQLYSAILDKNTDVFSKIWQEGAWDLYEIKDVTPKQIRAIGSMNLIAKDTPVSAIVDTNYRYFTDNSEDEKNSVPVQGTFTSLPCISCGILTSGISADITSPKILPTSFFYPLKLWLEKRSLNRAGTIDEKTNALLGLSLKRTVELQRIDFKANPSPTWMKSLHLLSDYLDQLYSIYLNSYKKSENYSEIKRIQDYMTLQLLILNHGLDLSKLDLQNPIASSLIRDTEKMKNINRDIYTELNPNHWRNTYVYDITNSGGKIDLNSNTLPRDIQGNVVLPVSYEIDGQKFAFSDLNLNQEIPTNHQDKQLTLNFSMPNLFTRSVGKPATIKGEDLNCITSSIPAYSGLKKYLITADVDSHLGGSMYVFRYYIPFTTESSKNLKPHSLVPDIELNFPDSIEDSVNVQFSGKSNDTGANVMFCSAKDIDPAQVFKQIQVTEIVTPEIFSYTNMSQKVNGTPKVSFTKINPTLYRVDIKGATEPYILFFSERYSPLWEMYANNEKNDNHFVMNGYANAWGMNTNGDSTISLQFKNQKLFSIGLVLTFGFIILQVAYILWSNSRKNGKK